VSNLGREVGGAAAGGASLRENTHSGSLPFFVGTNIRYLPPVFDLLAYRLFSVNIASHYTSCYSHMHVFHTLGGSATERIRLCRLNIPFRPKHFHYTLPVVGPGQATQAGRNPPPGLQQRRRTL
jgi:hypothetical protein